MRHALLLLALAAPLAAQEPGVGVRTTARSGVTFQGYYFGAGYAFDHVVEWTVPVTLSQRVGPRFTVDLSSAYAHASAATTNGPLEISGFTDTDIRASWAAVSGHLVLSVAGSLPTGKKTVPAATLPLLSALATDLFDFTTPSLGSGGGVTSGFATAFKLGERWAGGVGGSFRWRASYTPFTGKAVLEPGGEGRMRLGVEGPVGKGGGAYFRGALIYTLSGEDTLGGEARSLTGDRMLVYSGLSLPAGRGSLSLYGYDMYRLRSNVIAVPRGNLLALGARLDRPLSPALTLTPNLEFRHELAGPGGDNLKLLGWLARPGVDVRYRASGAVALVVQAQAAFGRLAEGNGDSVSLVGPRAVLLLEWAR